MSFDLYVFDLDDLPADEDAIARLLEDDSTWDQPLTPLLVALVVDLEQRHPAPGGDDPAEASSPWAAWPLTQSLVDGRCCAFNITWTAAELMTAELAAECRQRGLALYDPQESMVLRPGVSPGGGRRRWWRRQATT